MLNQTRFYWNEWMNILNGLHNKLQYVFYLNFWTFDFKHVTKYLKRLKTKGKINIHKIKKGFLKMKTSNNL